MRKHILGAVFASALVFPAGAMARTPTPQHVAQYERLWHADQRVNGRQDPGRNIVRDGTSHGAATDAQVVKSIAVLRRALTPPPAPVVRAPVARYTTRTTYAPRTTYQRPYVPQAPAQTASGGSGGYTIPSSIVRCESGGNYSAVNPSSGAGGAYQILPSTWHAYGGQGLPQNASPAEQGQIAARIYAGGAGRSQWSC